jgi:AcrR family transcriptional regulator
MPEKPPSLRERQAQLTRDEILKAARRLFAERGYTRTSVRDIAEAAAVSAQTVYDSIGSKQALVARLNDLIDAEAGIAAIVVAAARSGEPAQVAAMPAKITRSILEHCGDIVHALVTGAAAEPDLATALVEGHRRHVEGAGMVVGLLRQMDALDDSVDAAAAVETLAAISDVQFALLLRDSYGWSLDRIESWIAVTSQALLLRPAPSGRRK